MRLFITGGTGWFGLALLRHWVTQGSDIDAITILCRDPQRFTAHAGALLDEVPVTLVRGDVTDPLSLPTTGSFTHLVHAANESRYGASYTQRQRYDGIVDGTRNVLDLAVRLGVPRFLFTSSGAVYGRIPATLGPVPETFNGAPDPLAPESAYGIAKRTGEHLCTLYRDEYGLETVIGRCFAFCGEDMPFDGPLAIGNFIRDVVEGRPVVIQSDGSATRSYLDQRDLAVWLMALLTEGTAGQVYNVGSDQPISIADLAGLVTSTLGSSHPPQILGAASGGERSYYVPDITRARTQLGLDVATSLEDSIAYAASRMPHSPHSSGTGKDR